MRAPKRAGHLLPGSLPDEGVHLADAPAGHLPHPPTPSPDFLTTEQVAELLQVSSRTLTRWAAADRSMPVYRIGGVTRYHRRALERRPKSERSRRPSSVISTIVTVASFS